MMKLIRNLWRRRHHQKYRRCVNMVKLLKSERRYCLITEGNESLVPWYDRYIEIWRKLGKRYEV